MGQYGFAKKKGGGLPHLPSLQKPEPAFGDAVHKPDKCSRNNHIPHHHNQQNHPQNRPCHKPPKGTNLPRIVTIQPRASGLCFFHMGNNHSDNRGDAYKKRNSIQCIHCRSGAFWRAQGFVFDIRTLVVLHENLFFSEIVT